VDGQTAGAVTAAAASFAVTYAMGKAANHFLAARKQGRSSEAIAAVYQAALREAFRLAKERNVGAGAAGGGARARRTGAPAIRGRDRPGWRGPVRPPAPRP